MGTPLETNLKPLPKRSIPRWTLAVGLLCFVVSRPLMKLVDGHGESRKIETIRQEDIKDSVATALMQWEVFGKPKGDSQYMRVWHSLADGIWGVKGISETDGNGLDWFEVELKLELANQLRDGLSKVPGVQQYDGWPGGKAAPAWWPEYAAKNARCYQRGREYLIFPAGGTHAWFVRTRI